MQIIQRLLYYFPIVSYSFDPQHIQKVKQILFIENQFPLKKAGVVWVGFDKTNINYLRVLCFPS